MGRTGRRRQPCPSGAGRAALLALELTTSLLVWASCATAPPAPTAKREAIPSHVYARPLNDVLMETKALLVNNGWHVQRSGNTLVTDWRSGGETSAITYRVYGQRVDAGYCSVRIERVLATRTLVWTEGHPVGHAAPRTSKMLFAAGLYNPYDDNPDEAFYEDTPNDTAGGTAIPFGLVISHYGRDKALELALQQQLEPQESLGVAPAPAPVPTATAVGTDAAALPAPVAPVPIAARHLSSLAGIWEGTFSFRGTVKGGYSGEVTVAVDGDSAEVADFCPERGGTMTATGAGASAAWEGHLYCPAIRLKGCSSAALSYDFATATLQGSTLTVVATGMLDTPAACGESGPVSVTFVAEKADYAHLSVIRTKGQTACVWPSDWEDLASTGSMAMPPTKRRRAGLPGHHPCPG